MTDTDDRPADDRQPQERPRPRRAATFLARIAQAVREQNWAAVAIEIVIVVFGVVVGFQITAWGQARQAAADEEQALRRLAAESESIVDYLGQIIAFNGARLRRLEADIGVLLDDSATAFSDSTEGAGLLQAFRYPAVAPPRSVYDELTGSGRFGDLSSPDVRQAVAAYYAELDFIESQLPFFRQGIGRPYQVLGDGARLVYEPSLPFRVWTEMDLNRLRADPVVERAVLSGLRDQMVFQHYRRGAFEAAVAMCERLAEAVGEVCEAVPPSTDRSS